jgi:3-oxoacyl-[acyl-carrier-protein] synthase II
VSGTPAAITGVGAVTPLGTGAETLYERWKDGVCGLEDGVGACKEFEPTDYFSKKEARRTDRFVQFAIVATDEALAQAWGEDCPYDPDRVGCVLGVSMGGSELMFEEYNKLNEKGPQWVSPLTVPVTMPNAPPAVLAMRYGFHGEAHSIASACASSAQAIGVGLRMIRLDEADAVIVGGAEACLTDYILTLFRNAGALSRSGNCRPFDVRRDGFVMGEGAGILILEKPELAEKRGAEVLGRLAGYGSSTDAHHLSAPEESGRFAANAMSTALGDAGLKPEDVAYVNAHGTSTQANDAAETKALKLSLGECAKNIPVSSTKSVVGHSIGAAGGVEAVATLMSLRNRMAPPTVGLEEPDLEQGLDLNYVPGSPQPIESQNGNGKVVALSNSFAFGGHNAAVALTT